MPLKVSILVAYFVKAQLTSCTKFNDSKFLTLPLKSKIVSRYIINSFCTKKFFALLCSSKVCNTVTMLIIAVLLLQNSNRNYGGESIM